MIEIEFERAIVDLAHTFGWKVASFRQAGTGKGWRTPVKYDGKGYVDLTMVHSSGKIIFAEIKAAKGKLSPEQVAWQETLLLASTPWGDNVRYFVWKPKDSNQIAKVLSFGRVTSWAL
jgi:hypothetical protein